MSDLILTKIASELSEIDHILENIQLQNPSLLPQAHNLLQYVVTSTIRSEEIQELLAHEGFSSLGRSQAHIRYTIVKILQKIANITYTSKIAPPVDFQTANMLKKEHAKIFGVTQKDPYVMVTLPTDAADDTFIIDQLVDAGVTLFRINTAHDTPLIWQKMATYIKTLRRENGIDLKIYVDLAGPKIRTGEMKHKKIAVEIGEKVKVFKKHIKGDRVKNDDYQVKISCTHTQVFDFVKVDDPIFIDDGKISGVICDIDEEGFIFEVHSKADKGGKIKTAKGINFPKSHLALPALTDEDKENLEYIVAYADIIGLSFTQSDTDINHLIEILQKHQSSAAIVPKIETQAGVTNLIKILLTLIASNRQSALMIARGDLAIEIGFENLPFVQQEIIDLCNAATLPVIYATQVLESKMKTNIPSRAETIDAAYANRTDCIMLNKGSFTQEAVGTLLHILARYKELYDGNRHLLSVLKEQKASIREYLPNS